MSRYKILYSLLLLFSVVACDSFESIDDLTPKYKLTEGNTYTDATKVEAALAGVYAGMRNAGTDQWPARTSALAGFVDHYLMAEYLENRVPASHPKVFTAYQSYYTEIQRASFLIDNIDDEVVDLLDNDRKLEIEAEARIARAMCHFDLLAYFGQFYDLNSTLGVVVRTQASRDMETPARNSVQEVYDAINVDLDFAIANAPDVSAHSKFSKTVARAVKAKVMLYMGNYNNAASLAQAVMEDGNYSLESNFGDVFQNSYNSSEVLFAPLSDYLQQSLNLQSYFAASGPYRDIADAEVAGAGNYDARYVYTYVDGAPLRIRNNKYPFKPRSEGEKANTVYKLRLAEVYLIYAEAKARLASSITDQNAIDAEIALNAIRSRAGMTNKNATDVAELLENIRIEKILELVAENGQPWFDMVRYHILGNINISDIKPTIISNDQLIMPMPIDALQANSALVPNPGY